MFGSKFELNARLQKLGVVPFKGTVSLTARASRPPSHPPAARLAALLSLAAHEAPRLPPDGASRSFFLSTVR